MDAGAGNLTSPSSVFKVAKFSTRWMRFELINDGTHGGVCGVTDRVGVGLRQIKAFCSPVWTVAPAHSPQTATWMENPSAAPAGPSLNRIGADSIHPPYVMPDFAGTCGGVRRDAAIALPSDYSLMAYSVPKSGVSEIPASGSALLNCFCQILESAHHKHTLQDMLSTALQDLVDKDCSLRCQAGYQEVRHIYTSMQPGTRISAAWY